MSGFMPSEHQVAPEPGDAEIADEGASSWALVTDETAASSEFTGSEPEPGVDPDEGGRHWQEQPEVGLAEGHGRDDDDMPEPAAVR